MQRIFVPFNASRTFFWAPLGQCTLLVVPTLIFSVVLIVLVKIYEFKHHHSQIAELSLDSAVYADVYYVDLAATRLITVASLSSSTVLTLMGSFMTLLSYSVAADLIWTSQSAFVGMLPNPVQLALLVDLLDGKKMAICQWLAGFWSDKFSRKRSLWVIEVAVATQLFVIALCIAISGVDTWLHLSTESVTMPYLQPANPIQAGAAYQYSRKLSDNCVTLDSNNFPCSIKLGGLRNQGQIQNIQEIDALIMNQTSAASSLYLDQKENYVYIGPPPFQNEVNPNDGATDQYPQFNASTFVTHTLCSPIDCNLKSNGDQKSYSFSCTNGFARDATTSLLEIGPWYQNGTDKDYTGYSGLAKSYVVDVGLQFGVFAHLDNFEFSNGRLPDNIIVNNGSDASSKPSVALVLQCNSILGGSSYIWANNSLAGSMDPIVPNQILLDVALGPMLSQGRLLSFPSGALQIFFDRLNFQKHNNTLAEIKAQFGFLLGEIALSFLGASIEASSANSLQLPNSTIVTQVPKLPLFTLVTLNVWYAGLAICIYGLAYFLLSTSDNPADIIAVRKLLSVRGLTQAAVRDYHCTKDQNIRIGVVKRDEQWYFKEWLADSDNGETEGLLGTNKEGHGNDTVSFNDNGNSEARKTSTTGESLNSALRRLSSAGLSIRYANVETGPMLRQYNVKQTKDSSSPPVSPISYTDDFFLTSDQEEQKRISRSLDWADGAYRV